MSKADLPISVRYAVLWHAHVDQPHFDLLVETRPGSDLATWRLSQWPIESASDATRLKDHRRIYLDYEGDLSGHRGRVERIDGGSCTLEIGRDAIWTLRGVRSSLQIILQQISGDQWRIEGV